MTVAERQARRRERLVDRAPVLDALVGLALARRDLDDLIRARADDRPDPHLHARHRAIFDTEHALCIALGKSAVWAHREATAVRLGMVKSPQGWWMEPPTPR